MKPTKINEKIPIQKSTKDYINLVMKAIELNKLDCYDSILSTIADLINEENIDINHFANWLKTDAELLSLIRSNSNKYRMLNFIKSFFTNSISIEDLF